MVILTNSTTYLPTYLILGVHKNTPSSWHLVLFVVLRMPSSDMIRSERWSVKTSLRLLGMFSYVYCVLPPTKVVYRAYNEDCLLSQRSYFIFRLDLRSHPGSYRRQFRWETLRSRPHESEVSPFVGVKRSDHHRVTDSVTVSTVVMYWWGLVLPPPPVQRITRVWGRRQMTEISVSRTRRRLWERHTRLYTHTYTVSHTHIYTDSLLYTISHTWTNKGSIRKGASNLLR